MLIVLGPANAMTLTLSSNLDSVHKGEQVEFIVEIDTSNEIVDGIEFELNGAQRVECKFSPEGEVTKGCKGMEVIRVNSEKRGYSYGYGYSSGNTEYKIVLNTSEYVSGSYSSVVRTESKKGNFSEEGPELEINGLSFDTLSVNSTSRSSGCFDIWECSEWSVCVNGGQIRVCKKKNSSCDAQDMPEVTKPCFNNLVDDLEEKDIEKNEISRDELIDYIPSSKVDGLEYRKYSIWFNLAVALILSLAITIYIARKK